MKVGLGLGVSSRRRVSLFTPTSVSGLKLWLEADRIVGLANADPVVTWADASGLGNDVTQATGSKQPTYRTNVLNGKPVVRFGGTDDLLVRAGAPPFSGQCGAVFLVVNLSSVAASTLFSSGDEAADVDRLQVRTTAGGILRIVTVTAAGAAFNGTSATTMIAGTTYVIGAFTDGATWTMTVNGAPSALSVSGVNSGDWFADWSALDNVIVGAFRGVAGAETEQSTGDFGAVLVYDRATALTATEQRNIAYGLGYRYGAVMA